MKKILCFIFALVTCLVFTLSVSAEEAVIGEETAAEATEVTVLDRIEEFITKYTAELLSGSGVIATVGMFFVIWKKQKPYLKELLLKIKNVIKSNEDSADVQDKQCIALNGIIDAIDAVDKKVTEFEKITAAVNEKQVETTEHFKEIQKSLCSLARLFDTVYSNSKALPQGTKDMVHSACAECIMIAEHEIYGETEGEANEQQE